MTNWHIVVSLALIAGCSDGVKVAGEICDNGVDDEGDGAIDCDDVDCAASCDPDTGKQVVDSDKPDDTSDADDTSGNIETAETGEPWDPNKPLELCINEFMPDNETAAADETGAYVDWIELHNPNEEDIALDGWTLSDDPDDPTVHTMTGGLTLGAGEFLLLWADGLPELGADHLGFKLDGDGESVGVYAPDGRGSVVRYGELPSDISAARVPDCCSGSEGCWEFVYQGTPGSTNTEIEPEEIDLVDAGSTWSYWDGDAAPTGDWTTASYDDSAWSSGEAPLGYGDTHIVTTVDYGGDDYNKHTAVYFRLAFSAADVDTYTELKVRVMADDGAVVYLNGTEISRVNMPDGDIAFDTLASGTTSSETGFSSETVDLSLLMEGDNVLAAEVHQASASSSDLGFDLSLAGEYMPESR